VEGWIVSKISSLIYKNGFGVMIYMERLLIGCNYEGNFKNDKKDGFGRFNWYYQLKINKGQTEIFMMVIGLKTKFTGKENLFGLMEDVMMDYGIILKCTEKAFLLGKIKINMKAITNMMWSMDRENLYGLMAHQSQVNL